MKSHRASNNPLEHRLTGLGNLRVFFTAATFIIITILLDYKFGIVIKDVTLGRFGLLLALVMVFMAYMAIIRRPTPKQSIGLYLYIHLVVAYGLIFIVPIISPYLFVISLLALIVYFELGAEGVVLSILFFGVTMSSYFLVNNQVTGDRLGVFLVYYAIIILITYYLLSFLKIARDERQALEQFAKEINLERSRLQTLVNNLNDGVLACDNEFRIVLANPKLADLLDVERSVVGKSIDSLIDLRDADGQQIRLSHLADTDKHVAVYNSYRMHYSDKDFVNLYIGINQIRSGHHAPDGYVILLRDITKVKSLEEERNEFIYIMSHELRTPVSIVEGGISLAKEFVKTGAKDKALDSLDKAHNQSVMLASIVSSLSMLVSSEKDAAHTQTVEIEPKLVIDKVKSTYQQEVHQKGLKFHVHHEADTRTIYTNQEYLFEILQNLMTNAIKYTQEGSVTIAVSPYHKSHIAFSVTDTGIGISKSDQNHIFEKFWRSEDYKTRRSGGTGLGLYLTKKLADSIGARIEVESSLGKGSTFTVYVPIYDTQEV